MSIDPVSLAITAALTAAQMAMQASKKIEGPRLDDLSVNVADYGTPLNYFVGTRRFDGCPIFFAEPLTEIKQTRKTKGGKFTDYKYSGTWAIAVADHEIDAVTRVWFDKHLVYDVTGTGPVTPFSIADGFSINENMRFYLGTEDQEADPRMQATVDAAQGAGSCPAYRGVSYIFFENVPLDKFGNRVPQVNVEAVTNSTPHYPYESISPRPTSDGFTYSPDFSRFLVIGYPHYEIWDVAARSQMVAGDLPATMSGDAGYGISSTGTIYTMGADHRSIQAFSPDGLALDGTITGMAVDQSRIVVLRDGGGREHLFTQHDFYDKYYSLTLSGVSGLAEGDISDETGYTFTPKFYFTDSHGDGWMVGSSLTELFLYRVVDTGARPGSLGFARIVVPDPALTIPQARAAHYGSNFIVAWNTTKLYLIDETTMTITDAVASPGDTYADWANLRPGSKSIWLGTAEVSLVDLSTIRTINYLDWKAEDVNARVYEPASNALICFPQFADNITWRYLDRVAASTVALSAVVERVATSAGLDLANIDVTDLDQEIIGYSWTQGSGKDVLDPLLDAYDSIVRPHDFTLQFLKRGATAGGTILTEKFVRQGDSRYKLTIVQDTDLPRRVSFNFADVDADQQTNAAVSQRPVDAMDSLRDTSINMTTLALDAATARQLSDRWFRRQWFSRNGVENALTMQLVGLEPGDVRTMNLDGNAAAYRLTKQDIGADGSIGCKWVRDDPSVAVLSGADGAAMDGRAESVISVAVISKGFVLDIPLITDSHNSVNPLLYYGAGPYAAGSWPGATIYQGTDGEYTTEWANVASTAGLTWGYTTEALATANPWLWDRGNTVNVIVKNGAITSTTEAVCNATPTANLCLLGDELLQFTTATLETDGSYTLSGLKRGRRGTEWAVDAHAAGDQFVMLDLTGNVGQGLSDVGTDLSFKAVTSGRDAASAFPIPVAFSGASLKPYAPALVNATKDAGSGDWTITWVRRSRVGGAWTGGTTVPLGEATEAYEVDILDSLGAVVRTYTGLTSPTATYSAADQTSDGGSVAIGDLYVNVYQISASVDRGFAAQATA